MSLGIDTGARLDLNVNRWNQFLLQWGQYPEYAGRYFGATVNFPWVPGELGVLQVSAPSAASIRYILPFAPTGPVTQDRPANLSQHGLQNSPVQYRVQGETEHGRRLPSSTVIAQGRADAKATGEAIAAALRFVDPTTGMHEFVLPDTEAVFVFLDVEPQTGLNSNYWLSWAETLSNFNIDKETSVGTIKITQPLRPCLYCACDEDGPFDPEITNAFRETGFLNTRIRGRHTCHALATMGWNKQIPFEDAISATQVEIDNEFTDLGDLTQPTGLSAPVVLWQYRLNVGMDANQRLFEMFTPEEEGTETVFKDAANRDIAIDLSATSKTPYNNRPITDYMLRRL
jgi:hypothetical protein